jgi:hypothetical protein
MSDGIGGIIHFISFGRKRLNFVKVRVLLRVCQHCKRFVVHFVFTSLNDVTEAVLDPPMRSSRCVTQRIVMVYYFLIIRVLLNPFSTEPTWVHSYAITCTCWTKQAMDVNFQLWIDKMVNFNLTPSGITSVLTLTVSCVLNRPNWPLLRG